MPPTAPQLRPIDPPAPAAPQAPAPVEAVDLRALLRLLRRRLWVILAVVLGTFAAGAIRTLREQGYEFVTMSELVHRSQSKKL